jgi:hypothetical protein
VSIARLLLHVIALVAPLLVTFLFGAFTSHNGMQFVAAAGLSAVVAAQLACLIYWPWMERRARRGAPGWPVGAAIAAATHVLCALGILIFNLRSPLDLFGPPIGIGLLIFGFTLLFVGWLTFPLTMVVAHWLVRVRARELQHAA